jgi:alkyl hydroperoxide reductase subunit AhpC
MVEARTSRCSDECAGKYVVLLFYPCDFTYVDPTELLAFDAAMDQFAKLETDVSSS